MRLTAIMKGNYDLSDGIPHSVRLVPEAPTPKEAMSEQSAKRLPGGSRAWRDTPTEETICYWKDEDGCWWIYLPFCGCGNLGTGQAPSWTIEEHEDGTITVQPSIRMTGHDKGIISEKHGWLTRGVWKDA